jgi:hypothetical protein
MSKQIVEGKIDKVFTKDFGEEDRFGNQYAVNINVGGQWYGLGKKKKPVANVKVNGNWHPLAEGDVIEAVCETVERNGRTYNNIKTSDITVKEVSGGSGNSGAASGSNSVSVPSATGTQVSQDDRQDAIMRQSAMGYAAQIVSGTLTGKSDLDKAAAEVVRLANDYLMPYAKYGVTEDETRKEQERELQNQQAHQQAEDDSEPFDDDLPF